MGQFEKSNHKMAGARETTDPKQAVVFYLILTIWIIWSFLPNGGQTHSGNLEKKLGLDPYNPYNATYSANDMYNNEKVILSMALLEKLSVTILIMKSVTSILASLTKEMECYFKVNFLFLFYIIKINANF